MNIEEHIEIDGCDAFVIAEFDYIPGEPETRCTPGLGECFEWISVDAWINDDERIDLLEPAYRYLFTENVENQIKKAYFEQIKNRNPYK